MTFIVFCAARVCLIFKGMNLKKEERLEKEVTVCKTLLIKTGNKSE